MTQQFSSALVRGIALAVATAVVGGLTVALPNLLAPSAVSPDTTAVAGVITSVLTVFVGRFLGEGANDSAKAAAAQVKAPSKSQLEAIAKSAVETGFAAMSAGITESAAKNPNNEP